MRNLVNQLYAALNVGEHQLKQERGLRAKLEVLREELIPLEEVSRNIFSMFQIIKVF